MNVDDVWGIKWITQTNEGRDWAEDLGFDDAIVFSPSRQCKAGDPRPTLEIVSPNDGAHLNSKHEDVSIIANATANFEEYVLEWAEGDSPRDRDWDEFENGKNPRNNPAVVASLDLEDLPRGAISLRLTMFATNGGYAEVEIVVYNDLPDPTPVPSATQQPSSTPTQTLAPTGTPTTAPPSDTPAPTETPTPSETPTAGIPTDTLTPTLTPT